TARLPLEMFDNIGDVDLFAGHSHRGQSLLQHGPRRPYERQALQVFPVPRLLPDHHHPRALRSLAKDGLGCALIQIAGCAAGYRFSKFSQTGCGIGAIRNTLGHIEFDAGTAVRAVFRPGAALEWTYADFLFIGLLNQRFHTCDSTIPEMNRYRAAS